MFLRRSGQDRDPLVVAMSGVQRGDRVLQIGINDPQTACLVAAKAGLSGEASLVLREDAAATKASAAIASAGATLDVHVAPYERLPFADASFDVAIVNSANGLLTSLGPTRPAVLSEVFRVVRPGGRVVTVEVGSPTGLLARLTTRSAATTDQDGADTQRALGEAGFAPVRELADIEGLRFVEGFRR